MNNFLGKNYFFPHFFYLRSERILWLNLKKNVSVIDEFQYHGVGRKF
jgi:hypothetical protein